MPACPEPKLPYRFPAVEMLRYFKQRSKSFDYDLEYWTRRNYSERKYFDADELLCWSFEWLSRTGLKIEGRTLCLWFYFLTSVHSPCGLIKTIYFFPETQRKRDMYLDTATALTSLNNNNNDNNNNII